MTAIRAVVFDLGHTVWDFAPTEHGRRFSVLRAHERIRAATSNGLPSPRDLERSLSAAIGKVIEDWNTDDRLEQSPSSELVRDALSRAGFSAPDDVVDDVTTLLFGTEADMPVVEPDSLAALAVLHERGLAMGCVTNTILLQQGIDDVIERLGLRRYFTSAVVSAAAGFRKPHPSLFRQALSELAVEPRETVFVGDRLDADVAGAKAVGMRAVLTHQYRQEPVDGASPAPDAVIQRLAELPDVIERLESSS
ncbi:MAG: HAD family hydrolase [Dehalococcoidia bacterium]